MPKMILDRDDLYPVYYINTTPIYPEQRTIEISAPLYEEYQKVMDKFFEIQEKLEGIFMENKLDE